MKGIFDDIPIANPARDKAWAAFIKRKDVKAMMKGSEKFKFPLNGAYDVWSVAWNLAWDEGFKDGCRTYSEIKKGKTRGKR